MQVTVTLKGIVAKWVVVETAERYARLCIWSKLPDVEMWNRPWATKPYGEWLKGVDARRAEYKAALVSMLKGGEVPGVPPYVMRPQPFEGRTILHYTKENVNVIAEQYGEHIHTIVRRVK